VPESPSGEARASRCIHPPVWRRRPTIPIGRGFRPGQGQTLCPAQHRRSCSGMRSRRWRWML
jgi:hypothetical protein